MSVHVSRSINRMVLEYLVDLAPVPQTGTEIRVHVSDRHRGLPMDHHVADSVTYLEAAGYIRRAEATAADLAAWTATATGIRQARRQVGRAELDPMIWGAAE